MTNFYKRENGDVCLRENRDQGTYRWLTLEKDRIACGVCNPDSFEQVYELCLCVMDIAGYMLGLSHLDIESVDVSFSMDFEYNGSHDQVIAEAFFNNNPLSCLLDLPDASAINFSPSVVISLTNDSRLQARICVDSKTSVFQPEEKDESPDEPISLTLTVRRYPVQSKNSNSPETFKEQTKLLEYLMQEKIIPSCVDPLVAVITQKKMLPNYRED
jgi:hypothetical protein